MDCRFFRHLLHVPLLRVAQEVMSHEDPHFASWCHRPLSTWGPTLRLQDGHWLRGSINHKQTLMSTRHYVSSTSPSQLCSSKEAVFQAGCWLEGGGGPCKQAAAVHQEWGSGLSGSRMCDLLSDSWPLNDVVLSVVASSRRPGFSAPGYSGLISGNPSKFHCEQSLFDRNVSVLGVYLI